MYMTKKRSEIIEYYKKEIKNAYKEFKNPKTRHKQIPNLLTASRLLSPVIILPLFFCGMNIATITAIGFFALTDFFDGKLARKYDTVSNLGKDLDAFVDKVFFGTISIPLLTTNPIILTSILLEILISTINVNTWLKELKVESSMFGKIKTWFLFTTAALGYANIFNNIFNTAYITSIIFTTTMQTIAAADYIKNFTTQIENKKLDRENNNYTDILNTNFNEGQTNSLNNKNTISNIEKDHNKQIEELEKLKDLLISDSANETLKNKTTIKR